MANIHNPRIPEAVQQAYDAVLTFQLPHPDDALFRDRIQTDAERESSSSTPLLLNENEMTNGMLSACIDTSRMALNEFKKLCGNFDTVLRPHLSKIDAKSEIDQKIEKRREKFKNDIEEINKRYATTDKEYKEAEDDKIRLEEVYRETCHAKDRTNAQDFPDIAYYSLLIIIGAVEWMINYSSFLEFYGVPAMAAGFTFAVALAVAVASHVHGTRRKAASYYLSDTNKNRKKREIGFISITTSALIIAISYVGWVRYSWAIDLVAQLGINSNHSIELDINLPVINVGQKVAVSLIANILVWFIGFALAYAVHDEDPTFTEKYRDFKKAKKHYDSLPNCKAKEEIQEKEAILNKDITELENIAKAKDLEARPLAEMRDTVQERITRIHAEADRLVTQLIRKYRTTLADIATVTNPTLQFNHGGEIIDLDRYRQIEIHYSLQEPLE